MTPHAMAWMCIGLAAGLVAGAWAAGRKQPCRRGCCAEKPAPRAICRALYSVQTEEHVPGYIQTYCGQSLKTNSAGWTFYLPAVECPRCLVCGDTPLPLKPPIEFHREGGLT